MRERKAETIDGGLLLHHADVRAILDEDIAPVCSTVGIDTAARLPAATDALAVVTGHINRPFDSAFEGWSCPAVEVVRTRPRLRGSGLDRHGRLEGSDRWRLRSRGKTNSYRRGYDDNTESYSNDCSSVHNALLLRVFDGPYKLGRAGIGMGCMGMVPSFPHRNTFYSARPSTRKHRQESA